MVRLLSSHRSWTLGSGERHPGIKSERFVKEIVIKSDRIREACTRADNRIAMTIATEVTTTSGNLEVPLPRSPLPDPGGAERSGFFLGPFGLLGGCCARIFLY